MQALFTQGISAPALSGRRSIVAVAEALRRAITTGTYAPNERLVEEDLARSLGTNRAVVRGALAYLEHEQLVVREPNRGARVRAFSPAEAAEILETRAALEVLVVRRAAERFDIATARACTAIVAAMRARHAEHDLAAYTELNTQFHRAILACAEHGTVVRLLTLLHAQAVRYQYRTVLVPGRAARSLAEHEAILAALLAHDADAAESAMRAHLDSVIATVRTIAEPRHLG